MTTNDIRTVVELLPCPFCQSARIDYKDGDFEGLINCQNCGAMIRCRSNVDGRPFSSCVRRWNTRTQPTAMAELMQVIELCREALQSEMGIVNALINKSANHNFDDVRKSGVMAKKAIDTCNMILGESK